MTAGMKAFEDPNNEGNSSDYHSGRRCVERGCDKPAGTAWSPLWCFEHNVARMRRIDASLKSMLDELEKRESLQRAADTPEVSE